MLKDYDSLEKFPFSIELENGLVIKGELIKEIIDEKIIPKNKVSYNLRYKTELENPKGIKNGRVLINNLGTFVCDRIENFEINDEIRVINWKYEEDDD